MEDNINFIKQVKSLPKSFWLLSLVQMTVKVAFCIALVQLPIYIAQ
jgi:hypothetical protein